MKPYTTWPKAIREVFYPITTKQSQVLHVALKTEALASGPKPACGAKIPSQYGRKSWEWSIVPGAEKDLCPKCLAIANVELAAPKKEETP